MDDRWQEIERIYHAAREMDATARAEFLAKACVGDDDLRREVESLLVQADQHESFLKSPAIEVAAGNMMKEGSPEESTRPAVVAGTMVAHYRLAGKIGGGGMGEVYRARDTKLQRDVALKILPETMAHDAERMARFEREAQVLASLNHPNIAAIYGLEESNSIRALVMELVEGETLAERIAGTHGTHLAEEECLSIAKQIAEALEYAHERGVIHRDLKPANVKITPEGTVKVLDFGLAKVLEPQDSAATMDIANSPTLSAMATRAGMILGTAAYMSPEQAKGQRVDRRCDIWAFGCVLYEMLAGRKAFEGETISDVLAAVIKSDPDWSAIPDTTPLSIQRLIRRCLQKDQRQRQQAIGDARITIEEVISGAGADGTHSAPEITKGTRRALPRRVSPWVIAAAGILAVVAAIFASHLLFRPEPEESAIRFLVSPPENAAFGPLGGQMSVSPDGRRLAFVGVGKDGRERLWIRSFSELTPRMLPGTEGAAWPFWSPDSQELGFYAGGKLKKIGLSGGPVQTLCDASAGGGTWNRDGVIVFANHHILYRVPEAGGTPVMVVAPDAPHHELDFLPQFLPDDRHFLFCAIRADSQQAFTKVGSLQSKEVKTLLKADSRATYAAPEYLVYYQEGVLMARRFDASRLAFTSAPVSVAQDVGYYPPFYYSYFSVSSSGVLAYQTRVFSPTDQLVWISRKGVKLGSVEEAGVYSNPAISPDGTGLAVGLLDSRTKASDIWVFDLRRGTGSPLTFDPAAMLDPAWSPDGKQIIFTSEHQGVRGIYQKSADGLGKAELEFAHKVEVRGVDDWSPDGRHVLYEATGTRTSLWVLPLTGQRKPFAFVQGEFNAHDGQFSPKGRYVAYTSDETGRPEVYVQACPKHRGKWQVSTSGGLEPMWRQDGNELFYLKPDDTLMSVTVKTRAAELQAGIPRPLFRVQLITGNWRNRYAVSPDGQRFLMLVPAGEAKPLPITVVLNWTALLRHQ